MGSIKPLPEAVWSSVRSGIILYDLTRVVEELVFNSLDAGATKVYVAVSVGTSVVKVLDNGSGINRDGLVLLGERYATSRYEPLAGLDACGSFGFRGEALCSIADVSLLEVITKAHGIPHGYRKVMKGRKCLYMGIDDDRRDVGTTVVVRDLFYNQPVRRKHMQSSPKKVLHSVKKCVLRIALVHSRVSFRVADIERDDELLSTSSSPSPLQLLCSNFGIEASSSLNELKAHEGGLKLSGYVSGPFGILSLKAVQYIYINSRFVCKGPIHKMLNQLATGCWENGKFNNVPRYEKRSRLPLCPAFILNLSCPRSLYGITVEPSKNLVEFRDWSPILCFIQNAVTHIWAESVPDDLQVNCEVGKKRCRTQKWQASLDECNTLPAWRKSTSSCQKSNGDSSELEKHQTESLHVHDIDNAVASGSASFFHCGPAKTTESHRRMQLYDNILSMEENFLDKDYAADNSNWQVDYFLGSRWKNESFEEDDSLRKMAMGSALPTDCHTIVDDADVNQDFEKPYELSSLRRGSLQHHGPSFSSEVGIQFACDEFKLQKNWMDINHDVGIGEEDGFDHLLKDTYSGQDEVKPVWSFSKCTNCHKLRSNLNFSSQDMKSFLIAGECSGEEKYPLRYSLKCVNHCSTDLHSSTADWIPPASGPLFDTKIPNVDNFIGEDDLKSCFEFGKGTRYNNFPDGEEDCSFTVDMEVDIWDQGSCSISSCADFSLDHELNIGSWRENGKFGRHKFKGSFFPNCSKIFADGEDYGHLHLSCEDRLLDTTDPLNDPSLSAQSNRNNCRRIQIGNQGTAQPHKKRSRRSHSAPPFHKHRKKVLALNDSLKMTTTINNNFSLPETSNLKYPKHCAETSKMNCATQQFNSSCLSSMSSHVDSSPVAVLDRKRKPESLEIQNRELKEQGGFINDCVKDFASKEVEDILDSGQKWHSCFPETECGVRSCNIEDWDAILDISSGILHLAGDSLVPGSIDKTSLKDARVLQQVDKKFIPVIAGRTLAIIDQHAADERIQLEELRQKVLSGEMKQITHLEAEQELVLPEIGYQLLHNYSEQIQNWGWICNLHSQGSRPFTKNLNALHRQPTVAKLLAVPCILGVNLTDMDLLEFLQQLADTDGSSTIPPAVHRVLNNKACRGAIMFGDPLLPSECSLIVEELKQTSLCFQCAHGRPTTVPLVNLDALHKQINKLGLCSSGTHGPWHGLHRHEISLNRAACRLSSAID